MALAGPASLGSTPRSVKNLKKSGKGLVIATAAWRYLDHLGRRV
jgi:hypothetical protein